MFDQAAFDHIVGDYNRDYVLLLTRASTRHFACLVSSFLVLRDLHDVIQVLHDSERYVFDVLPYPFSFRADDVLLASLGFDPEGIRNIYGFLDYVKDTQGMEFEDCLQADPAVMCTKVR